MQVPNLTFMPDNRTVRVKYGVTVLNAARMNRIPVRTRCDGQASCLMCKVLVATDKPADGLSPPNQKEQRKLGGMLKQGYRLACQTTVVGDAVVTIPEDPLKAIIRAQLSSQQEDES